MLPIVAKFWEELPTVYGDEDINQYFTKPELCANEKIIHAIRTKEDYIFDDYFWDIFHKYPFHICHISWEQRELRFAVKEENNGRK